MFSGIPNDRQDDRRDENPREMQRGGCGLDSRGDDLREDRNEYSDHPQVNHR